MSPGGLYLFVGPDRAGKVRRISELERSLGVQSLDRHHVDAATLSVGELLALYRQQPALSISRLIVVEQAHRLDRACVDALLQHAAGEGPRACLVLLVETELNLRHPLLAADEAIAVERAMRADATLEAIANDRFHATMGTLRGGHHAD